MQEKVQHFRLHASHDAVDTSGARTSASALISPVVARRMVKKPMSENESDRMRSDVAKAGSGSIEPS